MIYLKEQCNIQPANVNRGCCSLHVSLADLSRVLSFALPACLPFSLLDVCVVLLDACAFFCSSGLLT